MPAVMLPGRAEMVAYRGSTADREDCMDLERCILPSPRKLLPQGITNLDRGGIDAVPVLHATERPRQIDLLCPSIGQGVVSQDCHEPFEGLVEPPIESRAGHFGHLKLEIRPQDVCLVGPTRCPGREHHRPHQHPQMQLTLPLDHAELHAQAIDFLLRQDRLNHLLYVLSRHVHSPLESCLLACPAGTSRGGGEHTAIVESRLHGERDHL